MPNSPTAAELEELKAHAEHWLGHSVPAPVALRLISEVLRLRAVIRETHSECGAEAFGWKDNPGHTPGCLLHEIGEK